jgi:YD repeat-containing protein
MKVSYDSEMDIVRIIFTDAPIAESDEDRTSVILDYDAVGNIVGMEILDASKRIANPRSVEFTEVS